MKSMRKIGKRTDEVVITTEERPVRFLLLSGLPIGKPVARYGPIAMNTREQLQVAFEEYEKGTFTYSL